MATIYRICPKPMLNCNINDIYVGSTTQTLRQRFSLHKCNYNRWKNDIGGTCSSYKLFEKYGVDNCTIIEVERCCLQTRKERESYWIGFHNGVNERRLTITAHRNSPQWDNENRETHNQQNRNYRARKRAAKLARLADVTPPSEQ